MGLISSRSRALLAAVVVFQHVDGDKLHSLFGELRHDRVHLRHFLHAGTAPTRPEIEDHDVALLFAECKLTAFQQVQTKSGAGLPIKPDSTGGKADPPPTPASRR